MSIVYPRRPIRALVALLCCSVSACSSLPHSGPDAGQVVAGERKEALQIGFKIVNLDASSLPAGGAVALMSASQLTALDRPGRVDLIGPGDVLSITVFEVGVTLFGGSQSLGAAGGAVSGAAPDPTARAQSLNGVTVRDDGTIVLPYIGRLTATGHTSADLEKTIVQRLRGLSQSPQVLVAVAQNVHNTVLVSGYVARPGRQQLSLERERLLDAIAAAGGVGTLGGPENTVVRVRRGGEFAEAYLAAVESGGAGDIILLPGDRIDVIRRPRTFEVFGAANKVAQVPFPSASLSLAEAIAQAGGPDDNRANPTAVFVFRDNAPPPDVQGQSRAALAGSPMVYRLDMDKPSSYFLAQRFAMRDKDVIYIANAKINQTRKLIELFNLLFTPVFTVKATVSN
ncbi:polysaccharide biosynthesis/export family protein [Sphingomonas bacterium]|uniref:polysaccharide biosynthesis/export family protein n=1 Tax=Sphingomonas bacterium TaxID=1895847 RepID=UPI001577053C|nr:polysaccharide biosynthesis/export family protein [Sphingomonas bacterium]